MTSKKQSVENFGYYYPNSVEDKRRDVEGLALSHLSATNNFPKNPIELKYNLICSTTYAVGVSYEYRISMKKCSINLSFFNCEIDFDSGYTFRMSGKDAKITSNGSANTDFHKNVSSKLAAKAGADALRILSAGISGAFNQETTTKITETNRHQFSRNIRIIGFFGNHWIVGDDEFGDPRNASGILQERYFYEDGKTPLCKIRVIDPSMNAEVTLQVRARFGWLKIDARALSSPPDTTFRPLKQGDMPDLSIAMKRKIEGITLEKAIREAQLREYPELPPSEYILSQRSLGARLEEDVLDQG